MFKPTGEMLPYLTRASNARTMIEVGKAAADSLRELYDKTGAGLVMGGVTTGGIVEGGKPSIAHNLRALKTAIDRLSKWNYHDVPIFNHLLFKPHVDRIRLLWLDESKAHSRTAYFTPILYEFYGPILETKLVRVGFFLPRSERSVGCSFVREKLAKDALIVPLNDQFEETVLAS